MSTLSATGADGYFMPTSYFESGIYKNKSINKYVGSKGHNQYLTCSVVRFELPYDGICLNNICSAHIGKGTRFNAKKSLIGSYFTTKVWQFDFKCRICANQCFVIRTNPQQRCFDYVSGIKKRLNSPSTDMYAFGNFKSYLKSVGELTPENGRSCQNHCSMLDLAHFESPLIKLEKQVIGKHIAITEREKLICLLQRNSFTMSDDAKSNSDLRDIYRKRRKIHDQKLSLTSRLGLGNNIKISDINRFDTLTSKKIFREKNSKEMNRTDNALIQRLCSSSIFTCVNYKKSKHHHTGQNINQNSNFFERILDNKEKYGSVSSNYGISSHINGDSSLETYTGTPENSINTTKPKSNTGNYKTSVSSNPSLLALKVYSSDSE